MICSSICYTCDIPATTRVIIVYSNSINDHSVFKESYAVITIIVNRTLICQF